MKTLDRDHICFQQIAFAKATDKGLTDVSILTGGVEAKGHGVFIDEKTIEQFMELSLGRTIAAYLTHEGAVDEEGQPNDRLGEAIGMFSGFYRDGMQIRANFQFLDSFIKNSPKQYATLMEMAQDYPDKLGISPVMLARAVWVMSDTAEITAKPDMEAPPGAICDMPCMRISRVKSCDFVEEPAANYALFSEVIDESTSNKTTTMADQPKTILLSDHTTALEAKGAEIVSLAAQHKDAIAALEAKHVTALSQVQTSLNDVTAKLAVASEKEKSMTAALAAKTLEAEDAAKYDMRKAGAPALTIALQAHYGNIPQPADTDQGKWEQYAALKEKDAAAAATFKAKYLSRK